MWQRQSFVRPTIFAATTLLALTAPAHAERPTDYLAWHPTDTAYEAAVPPTWTPDAKGHGYIITWQTDIPATTCGIIDTPNTPLQSAPGAYNPAAIQKAISRTIGKTTPPKISSTFLSNRPAITGHTTTEETDPFQGPYTLYHTFIAYALGDRAIILICSSRPDPTASTPYNEPDITIGILSAAFLFRDRAPQSPNLSVDNPPSLR